MKINVNTKKITKEKNIRLNEGEYHVNDIEFIFSEEYEGLIKVAVFTKGDTYEVSIENDKCIIPYEVLSTTGEFKLGVYGYEANDEELVLRYSPTPIYIPVIDGSYSEGQTPSTPGTEKYLKSSNIIAGDNIYLDKNGNNITINATSGSSEVPTKTSDLENDSNFITSSEVDVKIEEELAQFDHLDYQIVDELPAIGDEGVRYLIKHISDTRYEEWIYVDGKWYDIGSTEEIDLSDYYNKGEINDLLSDKQDYVEEQQLIGWTSITQGAEYTFNLDRYPNHNRFTTLIYIRKGANRRALKFELTRTEVEKLLSKATTNVLTLCKGFVGISNTTISGMVVQTLQNSDEGIKITYRVYENGSQVSSLDNFEYCMYAE